LIPRVVHGAKINGTKTNIPGFISEAPLDDDIKIGAAIGGSASASGRDWQE
jgi:hypothetical protein